MDDLDRVSWAKLKHAYGRATDVPGQIRALTSTDEDERREALSALHANIFHQGTRFPATPHAVPFLARLAADPATPDRELILHLLASLALGYEEGHLPEGVGIARWREESAGVQSRSKEEADAHLERWVDEAPNDAVRRDRAYVRQMYDHRLERMFDAAMLASYDAVRENLPISLLADGDPHVRTAAAYLVSWFPEEAETAGPALAGLAEADADPVTAATAMFALSLLPWPTGAPAGAIESGLGHADGLVRDAAALALVNLHGEDAPPPARDAVVRLLTATGPTPLPYAEGDLATLAARVSKRRLPGEAPARARALIARLAAAKPVDAFPIAGDLLETVEDAPELRHAALTAIADLGDDAWSWINLREVLRAHGVPDDRDALREHLRDH
ncbi:hypothetical protein [Nonomuraea angiospora]|uniref:hypothetical protein n=1 Tax=Nonomuraea angiospora TaxID=46172 RepID=UPI0029B21222|nr:hypothetical protein [Nonomuraea angiospora]MDX3110330.1 hypothetical protein [Nonomuraea angiospora]